MNINNDNHNSNVRVDSSISIPNSNTGSTPLAHVLLQLKKNSSDYQHIKEAISNLEKMTSIHGCNIQTDEVKIVSLTIYFRYDVIIYHCNLF
jgi:hypothetical protein